MKTETRELLGFNVPIVGIVETLQEAISAAGSESAVLADYVSNVLAHSHYTVIRRKIVETLEKSTGIKRKTRSVGEGDKKKEVIAETEGEYVSRLETELGEEALKAYESEVAAAVNKVPVDYVDGTRGSSAPAKRWLAAYDELVSTGKLAGFCEKFSIDATQDEETVKVTVANKIKDLVTEQMKNAMKSVTG